MQNCKCYDCMEYNFIRRQKRMDYLAIEHELFLDEFVPVPHKKAGKPKKKRPKVGCPENNNKSHVYVWVTRKSDWTDVGYDVRVCCGCGYSPQGKEARKRSWQSISPWWKSYYRLTRPKR